MLITFEGVEASGKTTQLMNVKRYLENRGRRVVRTREPDGTRLGVAIRALFKQEGPRIDPVAELFLFMAARFQHVVEFIRPVLDKGTVVLCDRYIDSTVAYQGYGRGLDLELIRDLNARATCGLSPDLTLLFDVKPQVAFSRIADRELDRFEKEALAFHQRVRKGYLQIHCDEPKRVRLINAARPSLEVRVDVEKIVGEFLDGA